MPVSMVIEQETGRGVAGLVSTSMQDSSPAQGHSWKVLLAGALCSLVGECSPSGTLSSSPDRIGTPGLLYGSVGQKTEESDRRHHQPRVVTVDRYAHRIPDAPGRVLRGFSRLWQRAPMGISRPSLP